MERIDPPLAADERTTLAAYLDYHRATLLRKVAGLTDEQARWSPVPSGTSLFGLVSHLVTVERWWFAKVIAGLDVEFPWSEDDPDADFRGPDGATLADVVRAYENECARSRAILAAADLDTVVTGERAGRTVRYVVVHMIEETARHNGHADVLRELVDGATGE
jgi:uncharacterized damage-inducible protein DinB